jgi:hypothetical protein
MSDLSAGVLPAVRWAVSAVIQPVAPRYLVQTHHQTTAFHSLAQLDSGSHSGEVSRHPRLQGSSRGSRRQRKGDIHMASCGE